MLLKRTELLIVLALVALFLAGCGGVSDWASGGNAKTQENIMKSENDGSPAIVISAFALYSAFEENPIAAEDEYKGRTVIVDGLVHSLGEVPFFNNHVPLGINIPVIGYTPLYVHVSIGEVRSGGNVRTNNRGVGCLFADSHRNKISTLWTGQPIIVKGRVHAFDQDVVLKGCSVEKADYRKRYGPA
tara:strand:- start:182 stop:742 length:561 start_codon:yes stop_codon:yes gene_type:complete